MANANSVPATGMDETDATEAPPTGSDDTATGSIEVDSGEAYRIMTGDIGIKSQ